LIGKKLGSIVGHDDLTDDQAAKIKEATRYYLTT
jgi:hypothetical protein